jgi:hypothetical protein
LEIPNSDPLGGDMDGMGDMDNAPMPPMGADDMGMEDPMGGEDPNAMGGEDPMGGGEPPMNGDDDPMGGEDSPMGGSDDDELMSIVDGMSTEDKAAVIKYAKSMADDSEGSEDPMGGEMPMESRHSFRNIIDETINDVLDSKEGTKRPEKRMPKEYRGMTSPFKSPF